MKRAKLAILILIVLVGGIVIATLWTNLQGRRALDEKGDLGRQPQTEASMRLERIRLVEQKQGQTTWELEARVIEQFRQQNVIVLEDVRVIVHTEDGRQVTLSGDQGKVYPDSKNMELQGRVLLNSSDGYRLKTHSIAYEHINRTVRTSDPVEIDGKEMHITGTGMWVDIEARLIRILRQTKTRWKGGEGTS